MKRKGVRNVICLSSAIGFEMGNVSSASGLEIKYVYRVQYVGFEIGNVSSARGVRNVKCL